VDHKGEYNRSNKDLLIEIKMHVNAKACRVKVPSDTPLLYVLANDLGLRGPRFGCGLGQCGSCSVLINDLEVRSCLMPVSAAHGRSVVTLEGLPAWYAARKRLKQAPSMHPVQQTMIDEQAVQCGYCYNGMMIKAAELLAKNTHPNEAEIRAAMNGHICRCGTYPRILKAIQKAAGMMSKGPI
jgi:aerobic-type carbon monoxide dehydrogenase small subunit (CoxS/CutS family)